MNNICIESKIGATYIVRHTVNFYSHKKLLKIYFHQLNMENSHPRKHSILTADYLHGGDFFAFRIYRWLFDGILLISSIITACLQSNPHSDCIFHAMELLFVFHIIPFSCGFHVSIAIFTSISNGFRIDERKKKFVCECLATFFIRFSTGFRVYFHSLCGLNGRKLIDKRC